MKPGIHTLTAAKYHSDPCEPPSLSSSIAVTLCRRSPLHAWTQHPKLNPKFEKTESNVFDLGTVAHALLLEGKDAVTVVKADSWRTIEAKEARAEARAAGRVALLEKDHERLQEMVWAAQVQLDGTHARPRPFTNGQPEQTLIWEDDGVNCRARLDWLRDDRETIDDYKTTNRSAHPDSWSKALFGLGCDVQAAFYLRGLHALTGARAEWRWVVQETEPPYALSVNSLTPAVLELANSKVDYAISVWRECLRTGRWPGYPPDVCFAELPSYEETRWLEREAKEAIA